MIYGYARVSTGHQDNSAHAQIANMVLSKVTLPPTWYQPDC